MQDDRASADCLVVGTIAAMLLAGDLLSSGALRRWLFSRDPKPLEYICVAVIGMLVGFAELVSRYRDEPWRVARLRPGLIFITLNGLAACFALFMLHSFPEQLHAPTSSVMLVLIAGTGAMVAIRSKIFTIHQPGGTDVGVGPAFILDTMLAAINRGADRQRASQRTARVAAMAGRHCKYEYEIANDFLLASLGAFQNMDEEIAKSLRSQLQQLVSDETMKKQPNEIKYVIVGYSILTAYGDRMFDGVFQSLIAYLESPAPR